MKFRILFINQKYIIDHLITNIFVSYHFPHAIKNILMQIICFYQCSVLLKPLQISEMYFRLNIHEMGKDISIYLNFRDKTGVVLA